MLHAKITQEKAPIVGIEMSKTSLPSSKSKSLNTSKRRRSPLSPKPILDKCLLQEALNAKGIIFKDLHFDTFYQLLHRQHYPSLPDFVEQYNRNEEIIVSPPGHSDLPQRNPVSKKNKNIRHLPRAFLEFLADPDNDFVTTTSSVHFAPTSKDGSTTKMAVKLQDDHMVESVLMRHVSPSGSRVTLCVSSQVGCAMGCGFCATGTMGIRGNLVAGEILEQLVHAGRILAKESQVNVPSSAENMTTVVRNSQKKKNERGLDFVRNVVFMGMGEPLNNYKNVIEACRGMIDRRRWNLAHGRVTVSTVGVTPKMRQLTKELPEVNLALSLHAPTQSKQVAIVPAAKMYPIDDMIEALDEHMMALTKRKQGDGYFGLEERKSASKRKRAMLEYVMLNGDTSTIESAHQLGKLCENRQLVVNLIPYNQTDVKDKLSCPSEEHMKEFQNIVTSYGASCYIRRTMGADIAGACGQLVVQKEKLSQSEGGLGDIEDSPFIKKATRKNENKGKDDRSLTNETHEKHLEEYVSPSDGGFEQWVKPLAYATVVTSSCFAFSLALLLSRRRRI